MLQTETNTRAMEQRVLDAANRLLGRARMSADFEHGQWWVTDLDTGAQWSVCDADGPDTAEGFCFEQVSNGDDE